MLVSFDQSFLFVHIPKTGGTSIRNALQPFSHDSSNRWPNRLLEKLGIRVNLVFGDHETYRFRKHASISTAQRMFPDAIFDSLLKFTFVRNPWDLLVSNYSYVRARKTHKRHRRISKLTFSEFIEFAAKKEIGFQKKMISDRDGNLLVDTVGHFESLKSDFERLTSQMMIVAPLPHLNRVARADYREFYDARTKARVADLYRNDIETFGYEFDPRQIEPNRVGWNSRRAV